MLEYGQVHKEKTEIDLDLSLSLFTHGSVLNYEFEFKM